MAEYSTKDLAFICKVSISTVCKWVRQGFLKPISDTEPGKGYRFGEDAREKAEKYVAQILEKSIKRQRKATKEKYESTLCVESKCWTCLKSYNGCLWSRHQVPVPGWKAIKIELETLPIPTYKVLSCPQYEKEEWMIDENGNKVRKNEIPEEWKVQMRKEY